MNVQTQKNVNTVVRKKMLDLREANIGPMPNNSPWLRPMRFNFLQNGKRKDWDLVRTHESVSIIIFNTTRKRLVFVRQFRPAAYVASLPEQQGLVDTVKYPADNGITLELCSGIVDKDIPLVEVARDELREECGYEAPASSLSQIITWQDISTAARNTVFYVEVTDEMLIHPGGGVESDGELIEVIEMSVEEVKRYIELDKVPSPPGCMFGILWFLSHKPQHCL